MATERAHQRVGPIAPRSTKIKFGVRFDNHAPNRTAVDPAGHQRREKGDHSGSGPNRDEKGRDASQGSAANLGRSDPSYSFFVVFIHEIGLWRMMARFIC